jgi:hypothetical protein
MSAYKINIDIHNTPEQEVFISFQCNVLSKSEVIEFNGRNRTEISITCASVSDIRMFSKINKLQKGNRIDVRNLTKNDKEIIVSATYLVYVNTNNFSMIKMI